MKIAIVDDEKLWRELASELIKKSLEDKELANELSISYYESGIDLLKEAEEYQIILMDVEMPDLDGFEATTRYKQFYPDSVIIMLTTHKELMERGYMVDAFRYVCKARMDQTLPEAIFSAQKRLDKGERVSFSLKRIGIKTINTRDIVLVETYNRITILYTKTDSFECNDNITEIEKKLSGNEFVRCHRAFIVNVDRVVDFSDNSIRMSNGKAASLSVRHSREFRNAFIKRKFEYANS